MPGRRSGEITQAEPFQARQQAGSGTDADDEQDEHRSGTARGKFEAQERRQADARSDQRVLQRHTKQEEEEEEKLVGN